MKITPATYWVIAGVVILAGGAALFVLNRKKPATDTFGNPLSDQSNGMAGGITTGGRTATPLAEPDWSKPFSTHYMASVIKWVAPQKVIKLKDDYAAKLATQIYKAKGRWIISNDDEQAVENVFTQLKDKVQVSNIAQAFSRGYKRPLEPFLKSFLNESEMQEHVYAPVSKLPKYRQT